MGMNAERYIIPYQNKDWPKKQVTTLGELRWWISEHFEPVSTGLNKTSALWLGMKDWSFLHRPEDMPNHWMKEALTEIGISMEQYLPKKESWYHWMSICNAAQINMSPYKKPSRKQSAARAFSVSSSEHSSLFYLGTRELRSFLVGIRLVMKEMAAGNTEAWDAFARYGDREDMISLFIPLLDVPLDGKRVLLEWWS